jgi:pimeloyl-ACP methyl ester carboxylesterase
MRLDVANRGDSDPRRDGLPFLDGCVADVRAAMDLLQQSLGVEKFVLMGICSGAINSIHAAMLEPRVVGAIAIDGPAHPTPGYYLRRYARRIVSVQSWANLLARSNPFRRRDARPAVRRANDEFAHLYGDMSLPSRGDAEQHLRGILDRGVQLLFIYTGSWSLYNYEHQFRDAFPALMKRGLVRVIYVPDADHTFTRLHHQQRLLDIVGTWMVEAFGPARDTNSKDQDAVTVAR